MGPLRGIERWSPPCSWLSRACRVEHAGPARPRRKSPIDRSSTPLPSDGRVGRSPHPRVRRSTPLSFADWATGIRVIDHISLGVADLARAVAFYDRVLATLGFRRLWITNHGAGYGGSGPDEPLALFVAGTAARPPGPGWHLALAAPSPSAVDAFHRAATDWGGADEGAPGPRPQYGSGYYAAFIRDLDGYKLEAVFHGP